MSSDVGAAEPRFGVEEEFLVVDPITRAVVPGSEAVLREARARLGARVGGEITKFQVETKTDPCATVEELYTQLAEARSVLATSAAHAGLRIVASGSPVLGSVVSPPLTEGARQARGEATFRGLHDEASICAVQVHVELPDRERALMVSNHLRPYLPRLIALTANSPYWAEHDTGYASWRTMTWHRWPVAGPPPYFASAKHYDTIVATLHETGALVDDGTIFWDIRPSVHLPTLEIRVSDVPITAEESALFAALVRGLVLASLPAVDAGERGPIIPVEMMRAAYWRAARDGMAGHGVELSTGHLVPAATLAQGMLHVAQPFLAEHGDLDRVAGWLRRVIDGGDGATRQRRMAARTGRLIDVVDDLIAHTAPAR